MTTIITEEEWEKRFRPLYQWNEESPRFEDYYGDPQKSFLSQIDEHYIWTQVEDDDQPYYRPGLRLFNRSAHLVCLVPWQDDEDGLKVPLD